VPWLNKLKPLAEVVDFISIHTYPVWEYKHLHEAIDYTRQNYESVLELFPGKPIVITEAGWATNSNGIGIDPEKVNQEAQKLYFEDLMEWAEGNKIMVYFFEAFDENWKGSDHPNEPEKHWGLFHSDRTRKLAVMN
jgi:exo-beta-1,3-glucanase (GH17 family)